MFCRTELARLAKLKPRIDALGIRIMISTLALPEEAEAFCGERAPGILCAADPDMAGRKAFGLGRGNLLQMFGPAVFAAGVRATAQGQTNGRPVGDPWQMPGTFIIDRSGVVRLAHYAQHAGDLIKDEALLAALQAAGQQA